MNRIKNGKKFLFFIGKAGIVFPDFQLLFNRSANENLEFGLQSTGWKDKRAIAEQIHHVLKQVGMETKGYKMPHQLSGGEQQHVVTTRSLLNSSEIILADEPTGNLDLGRIFWNRFMPFGNRELR